MKRALISVVVVAGLAGCAPADLVVALQVQEGESLDTSHVATLLVRIGADEQSVPASRDRPEPIELSTPPAGPTEIVVFACNDELCDDANAAFVGCVDADLQPSPNPVAVFVFLFDALAPPARCEPFLKAL